LSVFLRGNLKNEFSSATPTQLEILSEPGSDTITAYMGLPVKLAITTKRIATSYTNCHAKLIVADKAGTFAALGSNWSMFSAATTPAVVANCKTFSGAVVAILMFTIVACHNLVPLGNLSAIKFWAILIAVGGQEAVHARA